MSSGPDASAEWWTTSDVAAYLRVRVTTVMNYRKRGQMPAPDATGLISDGVPINDVQRVMGHAQASTTLNMYIHAASEQDRYGRVLGAFAAFSLPSSSRQHVAGRGSGGGAGGVTCGFAWWAILGLNQ